MEDCKNPHSCTILVKGPNEHTIAQLKDAVRDGMRAVLNAIEDCTVLPGAGAFELACHKSLTEFAHSNEVTGKVKLGILAFADAMLVIPKTLAENSGFDMSVSWCRASLRSYGIVMATAPHYETLQDTLIKLQEQHARTKAAVGLDVVTGEPILPEMLGIWDNYRVKRQILQLTTVLASQLLVVDEVLRAGRGARGS